MRWHNYAYKPESGLHKGFTFMVELCWNKSIQRFACLLTIKPPAIDWEFVQPHYSSLEEETEYQPIEYFVDLIKEYDCNIPSQMIESLRSDQVKNSTLMLRMTKYWGLDVIDDI